MNAPFDTHAGALRFEDVPLSDVLSDLSRWYDVDFVLASPTLAPRRLTTTVGSDGLRTALTLIAISLDLQYVQVGSTVTRYPKVQP